MKNASRASILIARRRSAIEIKDIPNLKGRIGHFSELALGYNYRLLVSSTYSG